MICLRCGYCCIQYDVIIVDDPDIGIEESNMKHKPNGVRCQHLVGEAGECACAIHDRPWYNETPCWQFGQIEPSADTECRMGVYVLYPWRDYKGGLPTISEHPTLLADTRHKGVVTDIGEKRTGDQDVIPNRSGSGE